MAKKRKNSAFWPKLAMGLIFAVVVIYTAYHMISFFMTEEIHTIVSGVTTESIVVGGDGYVFRDETALYSGNSGAVDYLVEDGERVAVGQSLAHVYKSDNAENVRGLIALIDDQIALLEQCSGDSISSVDLSELRKSADDTYFTLTRLLASGEAGQLDYQIEKMMLVLSRIRAVTDGDATVVATLQMLRVEREKYMSGEYEQIVSGQSGYFYSTSDGYEARFSLSAVDELDGESFYALVNSMKGEENFAFTGACGRLAEDSSWKFVLPIDPKDAEGFAEGNDYKLNFPENNNTTFSMTLEKKVLAYEQETVLMVFYCNRLPDNFVFERCMTARIERSSVSGIYVPASAVKRLDGVRGVYVLRGNIAYFRRIDIIYQGEDYFLVSERDDSDGKYYYLGSNELIITNGKNLFDGRIVG
ncbi:MAG: hypothetical protein J6L85_06925 [Clostridia bacterium]|nr:hypothetical protein [Clostridia bacterium]